MTEAYIHVQCRDATGKVGTFLAPETGSPHPISPVFDDLAGLFPWMNQNGWHLAEHVAGKFLPWRAEKQ